MCVRRILLTADAAHVNTPCGGLGLLPETLYARALFDCLIEVYDGKADESILDKYDEIRRYIFDRYVHRRSAKNMRRLRELNPDTAVEDDIFLKISSDLDKDKEKSKAFQLVSFPRLFMRLGRFGWQVGSGRDEGDGRRGNGPRTEKEAKLTFGT